MATAKQKQIAKTNRDNAVKAMKNAKTPAAKAKQKAKVAALSKIMNSKTTSEETTAGSTKHALAKVARDEAKTTRSAAVKKMQDLKPKSKAWQKARRNVVTASSDVRKQGNVMRDVSGRSMGQSTSYTGPRDAMRKYIQDVEASKGGKALTKLGDKTEFTQINQIMLSEMPGKTYAEKRDAWDRAWGEPGSDKYRDMQQKQADRHSEMINDPDYDPDFVPKIFDNLPDTTVTGLTGPTVPIGDGIFGPPNPTVPSFGYPAYQDWTRFMPTNFQLAEGAGMHYQPWATGLPAVSAGMGGGAGGFAGPDTWTTAGPDGTVRNTSIYTDGPGVINPNIWGTGATTTTPTTGVIPGSDKANDLAAGRTNHPEMYDHNDMWIGAEGTEVGGRSLLGATQDISGRITGDARPSYDYESRLDSMPEMTTPQASAAQAANAMSGFQSVGYLGNSPGYFSPIDAQTQASVDQLGRVNVLSDQQEAMRALTARQTAQRFQNAMPEMTTPVAEMVNARTLAENAARVQAGAGLMSGGPNYSSANNAAINAVMAGPMQPEVATNMAINAELANQARIAAAKSRWGSMDDATQRTMMASAGKPNMGAMLEAMARQQALANISAAGGMEMGGLLGEVETNVDVGGTRGSATGGFGNE